MRRFRILLPLLLLPLAAPLAAGVVFQMDTTAGDTSRSGELAVEGDQMRMDELSDTASDVAVVFHGDRQELLVIQKQNNRCTVLDKASIESMAGQVNAAMQQIEQALAQVPEAQREMMRKMMEKRMGGAGSPPPEAPALTFEKSGRTDTVAGLPVSEVVVRRGGETVRQLWVTEWSRIPGNDEVRRVMEQLAELARSFSRSFSSFGHGLGMSPRLFEDNPLAGLDKMGGFPVRTVELEGEAVVRETVLRSIEKRQLAADLFAPPPGCKMQTMETMMQEKGRQ